jgi:AraC-like DNA-binding protein
MDVLSDVLRAVRLTGAVYFDVRARAPWVAETPATHRICANVMPAFEHAIAFHIMMDGWCWAQLADESEPAVKLEAGDAVIFVGGEGHFMSTERGKRAQPDLDLYYRPTDRPLPFLLNELGGDGAPARFVCGYLGCDARPFNPILDALPRLLHVRANADDPTQRLIRMALEESERPRAGGETILSKLSELMFLEAVRQYLDGMPQQSIGWLAGLRDRHVGVALKLMHGRPADDWTLDALAREVGLSRSAFAERFSELMGVPPITYLGHWRLQCAARLLEAQGVSIAQAAAEVGYESEAAFNRAFKKQVGVPPGAWRRARAAAAAP